MPVLGGAESVIKARRYERMPLVQFLADDDQMHDRENSRALKVIALARPKIRK
jgi:hypothetical protein